MGIHKLLQKLPANIMQNSHTLKQHNTSRITPRPQFPATNRTWKYEIILQIHIIDPNTKWKYNTGHA